MIGFDFCFGALVAPFFIVETFPHPNPLPKGEGMNSLNNQLRSNLIPSPFGRGQGEGKGNSFPAATIGLLCAITQ